MILGIILTGAILSLILLYILYLVDQSGSVEKELAKLIVHIDKHSDDVKAHLSETINNARDSLERFSNLENLTEHEFAKEEQIIKDLISELSSAKMALAKA